MSDEGKPAKRAARGSTVEHLPLPAHSIEAEQSVLGCLMLDAASWHEVRHLQVDDFFRADHRLIFEAMLELRRGGRASDAVTVADHLEQKGTLSSAGGLQYVARLVRDTATSANIATYVEIVRERGSLRALTSLAADLTAQAANGSGANLADVVLQTQDRLQRIKVRAAAGGACKPMDWRALRGDPPPRSWWIQDWLGPSPTLTSGGGGVGKTKLWQAIGSSLATGKPYLDAAMVQPLRVLMWLCEDHQDEVWRTQTAINSYLDVTMNDLEGRLFVIPRLGLDNTLSNDPHQVTVFVNGIAGLVSDRPFAPVMLGHVARSKNSEFAGSAAWENAVRMRWYVGRTLPDQKPTTDDEEAPDPDVVYLARRKANYSNKDWRRLRFKNGLLVPDQPEGIRFDAAFRADTADAVVIAAFEKLLAAGLQPSDKPQAADYLPKQIIAKGYHQGHDRKELTKAMNRLMGAGRMRREVIGKYANRDPKHGLVLTK